MEFKKAGDRTKSIISLAIYVLMLRNVPYDQITVKDICATAGVSRMSFYRYYSNKDDVFIDYCDERFEEFYDEFFKGRAPTGHEFIKGMFAYFKKYNRQLLILKKANRSNLLMEQFDSYAKYLVNNWKTVKESKVYSPLVPSFLSGGFFNVCMNWIDDGMKEDEEILTCQLFALFPFFQ